MKNPILKITILAFFSFIYVSCEHYEEGHFNDLSNDVVNDKSTNANKKVDNSNDKSIKPVNASNKTSENPITLELEDKYANVKTVETEVPND